MKRLRGRVSIKPISNRINAILLVLEVVIIIYQLAFLRIFQNSSLMVATLLIWVLTLLGLIFSIKWRLDFERNESYRGPNHV